MVCMADIITIDGAGRVVIPAALRRKHRLTRGVRIRVEEDGDRLVLEPLGDEAPMEEQGGLLVIRARLLDESIDHRVVRDERIAHLGGEA
jgi:AbrB family looped-hinge helix DNA binding protein